VEVQPLITETEEQKQRLKDGDARHEYRLKHRSKTPIEVTK
jgi:hypothetical protein